MLALAATLVASLGNMVASRNQRHGLPVLQVNAWSMLYGAAFVIGVALASGAALSFEFSWPYVASLLFLALFGSALAFGAYLTLMGRIGADRAAYTAVAIPIVALLLSTAFERLRWHLETFTGVAACVGGIALALRRRPGRASVLSETMAAAIILAVTVVVSLAGLWLSPRIIAWNLFRPYWFLRQRQFWTPLGSVLVHADLGHLLFNALTFWAFAFPLERRDRLGALRWRCTPAASPPATPAPGSNTATILSTPAWAPRARSLRCCSRRSSTTRASRS